MTLCTEKPRTVYFIRPIGMRGPIKIGCSSWPAGRRSALETWSPFPLEIIAEIDGCLDVERQFHSLFRDQHKSREWFDWSFTLQSVIDAINAGTFDIATLPEAVPFSRTRKRRDLSCYRDPLWKFIRSVDARLDAAGRRGADYGERKELLGMDPWEFKRRLTAHWDDEEGHRLRLLARDVVDEMNRRYPPRRQPKPLRIPPKQREAA